MASLDQERLSEVNRDIQDLEPKMTELIQRKAIAEEALKRLDIVAPVSGIVTQLNVHTIGGIIQPGETLMQLVPGNEPLTVEATVSPNDIDQVHVGGKARLRLTAFNRRVTPELIGTILTVSADSVRDERSGLSSFAIKIAVSDSEFSKLSDGTVLPGMVVEVYIETATRSVLSYLLKPATDQFAKVFREK
jgi:HlyD family secretion protein